jgi:hypothetical protein
VTCPTHGKSLIKRYKKFHPSSRSLYPVKSPYTLVTQLIQLSPLSPISYQVAASPMPAIYQKKRVRALALLQRIGSPSLIPCCILQPNTCILVAADMDPLQRLRDDVERAVPRSGAQVPRMQLLQHPADERGPGCVLKSLMQLSSRGSNAAQRIGRGISCYSVHCNAGSIFSFPG